MVECYAHCLVEFYEPTKIYAACDAVVRTKNERESQIPFEQIIKVTLDDQLFKTAQIISKCFKSRNF